MSFNLQSVAGRSGWQLHGTQLLGGTWPFPTRGLKRLEEDSIRLFPFSFYFEKQNSKVVNRRNKTHG